MTFTRAKLWRLGQNISKIAGLVGRSCHAVVSGPWKHNRGKGHWCVWTVRAGLNGLIPQKSHLQISEKGHAGYYRKMSEHTVQHSLLGMGLHSHSSSAHVHHWKCLQWACERQKWAMLCGVPFSFTSWPAVCVCIAYLENRWQQNILSEEGKLAEAVRFYETVWNERKSILPYRSWDCILYTEGPRSYTFTFFCPIWIPLYSEICNQKEEVRVG